MLQHAQKLLRRSVICAVLASTTLICIPVSAYLEETCRSQAMLLMAGVFWSSMILAQVFFWRGNKVRKEIQSRITGGNSRKKLPVGCLAFATSTEAGFCDMVLSASLATLICVSILDGKNDWVVVLSLSILLLAVHLHCILNGRTYRYLKNIHLAKKRKAKK